MEEVEDKLVSRTDSKALGMDNNKLVNSTDKRDSSTELLVKWINRRSLPRLISRRFVFVLKRSFEHSSLHHSILSTLTI